ncbi:MAG: SDR family NAD(P)-dependent oxidoreductase, partial [Alphaproteobacteria bacterium]|nr:SDR family NAD(P)-dependent oxidoreductase [Alphaproteobacteria bacterium]
MEGVDHLPRPASRAPGGGGTEPLNSETGVDVELSDHVVIVTGAAQGIGECVARFLAADGATLLLADIQGAKVAKVADDIRASGARVQSTVVDITDPRKTDAMAGMALKSFGRIDALVSIAGIDAPPGTAWEIDEAHWRALIDADLTGTWWCIKSVLPSMLERKKGRIVMISSSSARIGSLAISPAYSAAKA